MIERKCTRCHQKFTEENEQGFKMCPKCREDNRRQKSRYYPCSNAGGKRTHCGYEDLAIAIVLQAVDDWRKAYRAWRRSYNDVVSKGHMIECEGFFRSAWFRFLTNDNIDGRELIKLLREQEDEAWEKKHRTSKK